MDKIINMEQFLKNKDFDEQVLPFFNMLNTHFDYVLEDTESMFSMAYKNNYLYVFLEYIPRNVFTEKPNIVDRFFNVKTNPRTSKGEWVVNKIYEIGGQYNEELSKISSSFPSDESLINFLHNEIKK